MLWRRIIRKNKFVRTKMRLKLGTKIDLSERFVRFVRFCFPYEFRDRKKSKSEVTDGTDNGPV